jgi:hypothetical protein
MPSYQFHFGMDDAEFANEGFDLADDHAARVEAARAMGEAMCDRASEFWNEKHMTLTVTDRAGLTLFALDLSAIESPAVSRRRRPN